MPLDATTFVGPLWVTAAYLLLYYGFQIHIMRVKSRLRAAYRERDEKFDRYFGQDREMLAADRYQLNMLEHMPPFLVLLWLTAAFVDPTEATVAGCIYLATRLAYPLLMGSRLGRGVQLRILYATGVGYAVIGWMTLRLVAAPLLAG